MNEKAKLMLEAMISDYEGQAYERPGDEIPVKQVISDLKQVYELLEGDTDDPSR